MNLTDFWKQYKATTTNGSVSDFWDKYRTMKSAPASTNTYTASPTSPQVTTLGELSKATGLDWRQAYADQAYAKLYMQGKQDEFAQSVKDGSPTEYKVAGASVTEDQLKAFYDQQVKHTVEDPDSYYDDWKKQFAAPITGSSKNLDYNKMFQGIDDDTPIVLGNGGFAVLPKGFKADGSAMPADLDGRYLYDWVQTSPDYSKGLWSGIPTEQLDALKQTGMGSWNMEDVNALKSVGARTHSQQPDRINNTNRTWGPIAGGAATAVASAVNPFLGAGMGLVTGMASTGQQTNDAGRIILGGVGNAIGGYVGGGGLGNLVTTPLSKLAAYGVSGAAAGAAKGYGSTGTVEGALMGAGTGAAAGAMGSAIPYASDYLQSMGLDKTTASVLSSGLVKAGSGALNSWMSGGDPLKGASGGLGSLAGGFTSDYTGQNWLGNLTSGATNYGLSQLYRK